MAKSELLFGTEPSNLIMRLCFRKPKYKSEQKINSVWIAQRFIKVKLEYVVQKHFKYEFEWLKMLKVDLKVQKDLKSIKINPKVLNIRL